MSDRFFVWIGGWGIGVGIEQLCNGRPDGKMVWLYLAVGLICTAGALLKRA